MLARACLELGMIFHCLCGVCVHAGKPACVDRGRQHLHSMASLFCSQVASPALHNSIGSLLACHRPLPLVSRRGQKGYPLPSCSGRRRGPLPREHGRRSLVCAPSASCGLCLQVSCAVLLALAWSCTSHDSGGGLVLSLIDLPPFIAAAFRCCRLRRHQTVPLTWSGSAVW